MNDPKANASKATGRVGPPGAETNRPSGEYEAPAIEQVLTPADLEREVLYAGTGAPFA